MQLLKLEFRNINSLAGEWSIDFSNEAFAREGLFAIIGSTGSGKTTILDAISLALYGKTARQEKATIAELSEVMTHDRNDCSSKVSFRGSDGGKYRAEWMMTRKTRKGSDGGVNSPTVKIYELDPEKDISPGKKDVGELIVQKVGLDFGQFQRSMMLAQGQFDKFLTASDADRANILAQAAGTQIFSQIGTRIFEKTQKAKHHVEDIQLRLGENIPLPPEQRAELEAQQEKAAQLAKETCAHLETLQAELAWHKEDERLKNEQADIAQRKADLEKRRQDLAPEGRTLAEAERARSLRDAHTELKHLRDAKRTAVEEAESCGRKADKAESDAKTLGAAIPSLEERARTAEEKRQAAAPAIKQAEKLDADIIAARGAADTARANHDAAVNDGRRIAGELANLEKSLATLTPELAYLEALRDTPGAEAPEAADPNLVENARKRATLIGQAADVVADEEKAKVELAERDAEFVQAQNIFNAEKKQIDERIKNASRICSVMKAMNYDEVRKNLREGDRCPVCGKPVDGLVAKDLPPPSEFEKALDDANAAREASETAYNEARDRRDKADKAARDAEKKRKTATKELEGLEKLLSDRETQTRTRIQEATARQDGLRKEAETAKQKVADRAEALKTANDNVAELARQRKALGLPDDLAQCKKGLDDAVEAAAKALSQGQEKVAAANAARDQLRETLKGAQGKAAEAGTKCAEAEDAFAKSIGAMGFANEAAWQTACGDDAVLEGIRQRRKDLEEQAAALGEAQGKFDGDKARHDAEEGSRRPREEVEGDILQADAKRSEAEQGLGNCRARIEADDACRQKGAELKEELEKAKKDCDIWKRLNGMLGGDGGFRFSQYAQGLTLRALLDAANPFMKKITGNRYSLLWRPAKPADDDKQEKKKATFLLLPLVMDHDQHDTVRPISNVSGGERFEVSLALALGLSKMNAGRVKVETMFLDEGFGTLDPDRLGAALDVLCELHGEGTTIGVISHVKAVEDRLPLKIRVEPAGVGFGRLVGEGPIAGAVSGSATPPPAPRTKATRSH